MQEFILPKPRSKLLRHGDVNFFRQFFRDCARDHFSILVHHANDRDFSCRDFQWRFGVEFPKTKTVSERFRFFLGHEQLNFHFIFEPKRLLEIAGSMDAWPTDRWIDLLRDNRKTERPEKSVFGGFHEPEKIRVVHDTRHIGVGEFHAARYFEFVRHGEHQTIAHGLHKLSRQNAANFGQIEARKSRL